MALVSFNFDRYGNPAGLPVEPTQTVVQAAVTAGAAISYTAFAAALAVLVADGASPTQAHVTTANNAWTTLKALIDTTVTDAALLSAFTGPVAAGVKVVVDTTISKNQAIAALEQAQRAVRLSIDIT